MPAVLPNWPAVKTRNGWGSAASPALHKDRLFILNDNDRHQGNWKWARLNDEAKDEWHPIARDRVSADLRFDGGSDAPAARSAE